jgi:hypothetical protein
MSTTMQPAGGTERTSAVERSREPATGPITTPKAHLKVLGVDDILGADDLPIELTEVPEWSGSVYVTGMTGEQRGALEKACTIEATIEGERDRLDAEKFMISVCALCLVNKDRERLFVGDEAVQKLNRKSSAALQRVFDVASRLSRLTKKSREDLKGNSAGSTGTGAPPV